VFTHNLDGWHTDSKQLRNTDDYGWQSFSSLVEVSSSKTRGAAADLADQAARERAKQRCFCGAPCCRGWLGGKKVRDDKKKKKTKALDDAKAKLRASSKSKGTMKPGTQKRLAAAGTIKKARAASAITAEMKRKR
jgi:hypothetical protein